MMKKLLILMLVMGVASTANAALTLVSSAGDTLDPAGTNMTMIGIHNDTAAPGQGLLTYVTIFQPAAGKWTGVSNIYAPPALGGQNDYFGIVPGGDIGHAADADLWSSNLGVASVDPYGIGVLADFEFMCTGEGDVTITLFADDIQTVLDTITITQVPEPITFGLLGLGGLFLRRRK